MPHGVGHCNRVHTLARVGRAWKEQKMAPCPRLPDKRHVLGFWQGACGSHARHTTLPQQLSPQAAGGTLYIHLGRFLCVPAARRGRPGAGTGLVPQGCCGVLDGQHKQTQLSGARNYFFKTERVFFMACVTQVPVMHLHMRHPYTPTPVLPLFEIAAGEIVFDPSFRHDSHNTCKTHASIRASSHLEICSITAFSPSLHPCRHATRHLVDPTASWPISFDLPAFWYDLPAFWLQTLQINGSAQ